jgi:3',5'-cyclic-AMP phosphodiesterase
MLSAEGQGSRRPVVLGERQPLMKLAWLTDLHLNFVQTAQRRQFLEQVKEVADAVAVSGDIGESTDVAQHLSEMAEVIQKPIYFVLGNHDFYRDSITATRRRIASVAEETELLHYLTSQGVVELTPKTAMVGHDGWPDGRLGDFNGTRVILNDHSLIQEIASSYRYFYLDKYSLRATMTALADEAARHFERVLNEAAAKYEEIIAVTHVPPFREAAWHQGKTSSDDYLPYFACKIVGDVMRQGMRSHPQAKLLVLCGHTHSSGHVEIAANLRVLTGEARYGHPAIQQVLEVA